jgi:hypothetical protein
VLPGVTARGIPLLFSSAAVSMSVGVLLRVCACPVCMWTSCTAGPPSALFRLPGQTLQHVSIQMVNSAWARDVRWACSRAGWTGIPPHPQTPGSQAACSDVPVCGNWRLNPPALYPALGAGIVYLGACMDASPSTVNPVRPGPTTLPRQLSVSNRTGVRFTPHYIVAADGCPRSTVMGRSRGPPTPRVRLGAVERSTRATRL